MKILGIETSCDETAAAVVQDGNTLLGSSIASSIAQHIKYGGVVPEIAARSHIESIQAVISDALNQANCSWKDIDAIAVTYGAGLGGSLLIGVLTARTLAIVKNKPLFNINHVEAHVYANFITKSTLPSPIASNSIPSFPLLALIVSGGHTQLVLFKDHSNYELLGITKDDAIGEAFDKVAKLLGLPYPGGPSIAKLALNGNPKAFLLPKAHMDGYNFSFSGLKTAVLRLAQAQVGEDYGFPSYELSGRLTIQQKQDIAASFQCAAVEAVVDKAKKAFYEYEPKSIVIAGGVAANDELRLQLQKAIPIDIQYPDPLLCTDNGAMIASLGYFKALDMKNSTDPYTLDIASNLSM